MSQNPIQLIAQSPMSRMQVLVVGIAILLNALDGFDVLSISFAAPGIAAEWGIDRAALGIVLSMELLGMAFGSIFLGKMADRIGRKMAMLICLALMTIGMFMVTTASSILVLCIWRVFTGVGIGGMLATITAVTAEFANNKRRFLCVSLVTIGYPIGAVVGGSIAAELLLTYDWRSVFYLGTAMTIACVPLVWFLVPESVQWLVKKRPADALERANATLVRMGHAPMDTLPPAEEASSSATGTSGLLSKGMAATTVLVTAAYFFHITTFYFLVKWIPKIVVDMGYEASQGVSVLVWANVGGAIGGALFGFLTLRFRLKMLTLATLILSTIVVTLFGQSMNDLALLSFVAVAAGFVTNGGIVGLYSLFAHVYPTQLRASGTGFSIGIGRGGAIMAPILAGFLLQTDLGIPTVAFIMALFSLAAFFALIMLKVEDGDQRATSG